MENSTQKRNKYLVFESQMILPDEIKGVRKNYVEKT